VHLHSADLKNLKISLPTFREQTKISITVLKINDLIVANEKKVDELKQLKKYLMQNMFV